MTPFYTLPYNFVHKQKQNCCFLSKGANLIQSHSFNFLTITPPSHPTLNHLNLEINISKIKSGKFNKDKCLFLGFEFIAGYKRIADEKITDFRKKIIRITSLTRKKSIKQALKLLNNQILGFGHYYKFANCNNVFKDLDAFIRFRLRRYILKNKNLSSKTGNLFLTNQELKELGLKSLIDIKTRFDNKYSKKNNKYKKNQERIGYSKNF